MSASSSEASRKSRAKLLPISRDALLSISLPEAQWKALNCFKDVWLGEEKRAGGWGRIINGRHVCVLLTYFGNVHANWRLYVDGELVSVLQNIFLQMGSGYDAVLAAENHLAGRASAAC